MATRFELVAEQAGYRAGGRWLVRDATLTLGPGQVVGLVGPNGAGKSTLARLLAGLLRPASGSVCLLVEGRRVDGGQRARELAYVQQSIPEAPGFTAGALVLMGRYPHRGPFEPEGAEDRAAAARAMAWTGVLDLAGRRFDSLSGGERQRVLIARAFAQARCAVILDEPTASLDVRHQLELMARLRLLAGEGMGFVVVLHALEMAARWCDRLLLLDRGEVAAAGPPREVLRPELLEQVYGLAARVDWQEAGCRIDFELPGLEAAGARGGRR